MRRNIICVSLLMLLSIALSGCQNIGDKSASLSVIYIATAVLALALLIAYCCAAKKKDPWFLLLLVSVLIVNIGYVALAISNSLDEALLANRVAYLGSVFLPLSMYMIILNVCNVRYRKWVSTAMLLIGVVVFLIAASPGYLDIYYKEVSFEKINGVSVLNKVYGPMHGVYLVYLLGYFIAMVATIVYATVKDKVESIAYATILAVAVFVNIGVWLIEQLVRINFEILSVSYIISESFLLGLKLLMAENEKKKAAQQTLNVPAAPVPIAAENGVPGDELTEKIEIFREGLSRLTPKEQELYNCYVAGKTTDVIMEELSIKENTLKFHNKNLYGKLGVKSRKQLMELHNHITAKK